MAAARIVAILVSAALVTGCGRAHKTPPSEREWLDNASGFVDGLSESLELSANGGSDLASARHALHDDSDLYIVLVAYTRFGGCNQTLDNLGTPTARVRNVQRTLRLACARLQRAAALFTRAITKTDPKALVAANRVALRTEPLLSRAKAELAAVRPAPS